MERHFVIIFISMLFLILFSASGCTTESEPAPFPDWAKIDDNGNIVVSFPFHKQFNHGVERWVLETEDPLKRQYVKVYWQDEAVAAFQVSGIGNTDINQKISFGGQEYIASEVHVNTDGLSGWVMLLENQN